MSNKLRLLWCSLAVCLAASCVESERPLSELSKAELDVRLCGAWAKTDTNGDVTYLHIGAETTKPLDSKQPGPESGLMRFCLITHTQTARGLREAGEGQFFCTKLGGDDFANWVLPADGAKQKTMTYWFVKYQVNDERLIIWDQDAEATAQAIEAGKLKGIVKRKQSKIPLDVGDFKELRITDTTENIAAFLGSNAGKVCFPDRPSSKSVYARVR